MRNVESHLLTEKMDEAVTHYINSHQSAEAVHMDANALALGVQDEGRVITVMHPQGYQPQICRQLSVSDQVGEGSNWGEELLDPDGKIAAIVAHLAQHSRTSHPPTSHHKITTARSEVDSTSVMLDTRLFNGQTLENSSEPIVVQVPHLPTLPPLQDMKRCSDTDWFNKTKTNLKGSSPMLTQSDAVVIDFGASLSPAQNKLQSKKSLPHKKRISKKLKRNTGNNTPQQDVVVINCNEEIQHEEILPDNFVTGTQHPEHIHNDTHHITHEMRPVLICQLCGDFYGEEQLKFFQHLKQHYEPHTTIIIENPVPDLGIDKMTNTCIVDNVANLPDSIVELSLENTVPKTMYQPNDKQILYTTADKSLNYSNKVQYSMASIDKDSIPTEAEKTDLYETFDKLELYNCLKCNKSFRKQKQFEAHIKEEHSNFKLEDINEFSEPEDLMEGIHVAVDEGEQYDQPFLPHLTVDNGHIHQEHVRHWYSRNGNTSNNGCMTTCTDGSYCPVCTTNPTTSREQQNSPHLKEEALQRMFETDVPNAEPNFPDPVVHPEPSSEPPPQPEKNSEEPKKKPTKSCECPHCGRVFSHRNSLVYHLLSHNEKQQVCKDCGKSFYTARSLKIHRRMHNGDRPCKCDECGKTFRQRSDLKYHMTSIHSNQKHFKCDFCGKEFARRYSLSVHRRIHTGERNYKCEYCNKSFRASSYRLSHMRTHTGDKPYKCGQCGKCFRVTGDLRRHTLTHEKVRQRLEAQAVKEKTAKDEKSKTNKKTDTDHSKDETKKSVSKKLDRKTPQPKKNQAKKVGAPNVTFNNRLMEALLKQNNTFTNNVEVYQINGANKLKDLYQDNNIVINYKVNEQIAESERTANRDFATFRPIVRSSFDEKTFPRSDNMDSKFSVFTHIEKGPGTNQIISDVRHLEREDVKDGRSDENETVFLERLTALYNIPAV